MGVALSGVILGLGTFYAREMHAPAEPQIVLDIGPRPETVATNSQINTLLADVKELMGALKQTQHALAEAQMRIAALEQENKSLRDGSMTVANAAPAPDLNPAPQGTPPAAPAVPPTAEPVDKADPPKSSESAPIADGMGGPLVPIPAQLTARGPRACWMRNGSMVSTYRIIIRDDGFSLRPTWQDDGSGRWPEEFGPTMTSFRGKPVTAHAVLSRADFQKTMTPYYYYGRKQDTQCRFLVTVTNATTSPEAWTEGLELVERYFFKKIRGARAEEIALKADP
jgi:hypothetical protein